MSAPDRKGLRRGPGLLYCGEVRARRRQPGLWLALAALLLGGCGDDLKWDTEIALRLFKEASLTLGQIQIRATQGGEQESLTVNRDGRFFDSCDRNRVRVIPHKSSGGGYADVQLLIQVSAEAGGPLEVSRSVPLQAPPKVVDVTVVLGSGAELLPAGDCLPADGGAAPPTDGGAG